jgi:hypothetical protein
MKIWLSIILLVRHFHGNNAHQNLLPAHTRNLPMLLQLVLVICWMVSWCIVGDCAFSPMIVQTRPCKSSFSGQQQRTQRTIVTLWDQQQQQTTKRGMMLGRKQGVYTRPSAAIERGSGFFVPGLEGPKVRLVFGIVLLALVGLNKYYNTSSSIRSSFFLFSTSEIVTLLFSILVLLQGAIEYQKQNYQLQLLLPSSSVAADAAIQTTYQLVWHVPISSSSDNNIIWKEKVEWAATTYLTLTPATTMVLMRGGRNDGSNHWIFSLVEPSTTWMNDGHEDTDRMKTTTMSAEVVARAAWDTLSRSSSGRVSIPMTHPAASLLPFTRIDSESFQNTIRTVVLHRISSTDDDDEEEDGASFLFWWIASDQLLPAFSQRDLQWLGQLAKYVHPERDTPQ